MSTLFLISLVTGLGAGYLYVNVSQEVTRIMTFITFAICCVLAMVSAPIPIQLLLLFFLVFGNRNLSLLKQLNLR